MKSITINTGNHSSEILVGESRLNVSNYMPSGKAVIITDENVGRIYADGFPDYPVIAVSPGEESKSIKVIEHLAAKLLEAGLDRSGFILGIGGGVVCDIAGFLASIYMRGVPFGFISTSLLSQVDASVGGKNGVNLGNVKNVLGNFNQPDFVICDTSMLKSLPEDEYLSGLAELIKMGAIMDSTMLDEIEEKRDAILKREISVMESLVARSVMLKAQVVNEDEKESGRRMILNFGHTFGHVIETIGNQKHGFAIASGMVIAAGISVQEGILPVNELTRLSKILGNFSLLNRFDIPAEKFRQFISMDKKKKGDEISFVLIEEPGRAVVKKLAIDRLADYSNLINSWL